MIVEPIVLGGTKARTKAAMESKIAHQPLKGINHSRLVRTNETAAIRMARTVKMLTMEEKHFGSR